MGHDRALMGSDVRPDRDTYRIQTGCYRDGTQQGTAREEDKLSQDGT